MSYRIILATLALGAACAALQSTPNPVSPQQVAVQNLTTTQYSGHSVAAHRVLIKFKRAPSQADLAQLKSDTAGIYLQPLGGAGWYELRAPAWTVAQLVSVLSARANIASVEPDYVGHPMAIVLTRAPAAAMRPVCGGTPDDCYFPLQWALQNTGQCVNSVCGTSGADIGAVAAWAELPAGSQPSVVVDFDTGIDYNNPDLAGNVWTAPHAYTITEGGNVYNCPEGAHGFNAVTNQSGCTGQVYDDGGTHGHGTLTAGIMGAVSNNALGVAGSANNDVIVLPITICSNDGGSNSTCTADTAITGIDAAMQIASQFGLRLVAGNMSEGSLSGSALADEMELAGEDDGLVFSASTGNECTSTPDDPASDQLPNEIAASASDQYDHVAYWNGGCSNGGGNVAAPGSNNYTTALGDDGQNPALWDGTSFSAPFITGAFGMLASACPSLTPLALVATVEGTADQLPALDSIATDGRRLNMAAALASCTTAGATPSTAQGSVSLDPDPEKPDDGTITVKIGGLGGTVITMDYDTGSDTAASLAQALSRSISRGYVEGSYAGGSSFTATTLAKGPYTNYPVLVQVDDECYTPPREPRACGPAPHVYLSPFSGGSQ